MADGLGLYRTMRVQADDGGVIHYRMHMCEGPEGLSYAVQDTRLVKGGKHYLPAEQHWIQHYDKSWSRYGDRH